MRRDQCGFARKRTNSKRLVGSSVAKTVAPNNRLIAGAFGPGFPAKGRTASANIAYVQMKAILIVKAESAEALRALMRSLSAPLMHALISSLRQSLGCGIFNLFFLGGKVQRPRCDPQQRRLVFMHQRVALPCQVRKCVSECAVSRTSETGGTSRRGQADEEPVHASTRPFLPASITKLLRVDIRPSGMVTLSSTWKSACQRLGVTVWRI